MPGQLFTFLFFYRQGQICKMFQIDEIFLFCEIIFHFTLQIFSKISYVVPVIRLTGSDSRPPNCMRHTISGCFGACGA